jgi:hypothetical protein
MRGALLIAIESGMVIVADTYTPAFGLGEHTYSEERDPDQMNLAAFFYALYQVWILVCMHAHPCTCTRAWMYVCACDKVINTAYSQ